MITVYSTPTCAFCHMVKEYFKSKKIGFAEKDITKDEAAMHWVAEHTGQLAVPVIDFDGTIVIGFDRPRIDLALRDMKLV